MSRCLNVIVFSRRIFVPLAFGLAVNFFSLPAYAFDLFVTETGVDGVNDCQDIASPCATVVHAIGQAFADDTITIGPGTFAVSNATIQINLTLQGSGSGATILDAGGMDRAFHINNIVTVTMSDLTIQNGQTVDDGGGILLVDASTLTLNNCVIKDNNGKSGGGLFVNGSTLDINNTAISGNISVNSGGGIASELTSSITVSESTISNNIAGLVAGGILAVESDLTISDSTITGNVSEDTTQIGGGGVVASKASLSITNSTISNNTAALRGGGIITDESNVTISGSTINNNSAQSVGGGFAFRDNGTAVKAVLHNTTISENQTDENGGGIYNEDGEIELNHVTIFNNTADADNAGGGDGGGIFNNAGATTTLKSTIVAGNTDPSSAPDCAGTLTSAGFNLIQDINGCTFADLGSDITGEDPLLEDLADNLGETQTHALSAESPAVDKGSCFDIDDFDVFEDQRDAERPAGDGCDIGAYELSICGDDVFGIDEECEDGNTIATDDCTSECKFSVCGDGFVEEDFEDCDDGNTTNGDGCDEDCFNEEEFGGCSLIR